jgi:hypothetical protein
LFVNIDIKTPEKRGAYMLETVYALRHDISCKSKLSMPFNHFLVRQIGNALYTSKNSAMGRK